MAISEEKLGEEKTLSSLIEINYFKTIMVSEVPSSPSPLWSILKRVDPLTLGGQFREAVVDFVNTHRHF